MSSQTKNQLKFTYSICDFDDRADVGSDSFYDLDECVEALKQNLLENPFKKTWKAEIWINGAEEIADRKKVVFEEDQNYYGTDVLAFEVDDEDYEEEKCNTCGKNIDDDDDDKKCGEGCPEYDSGWKETH